jgi:hypothetical protein
MYAFPYYSLTRLMYVLDIDQVVLGGSGSPLLIPKQSIGVASSAKDFNDVDGILGIGPVDLTQGSIRFPLHSFVLIFW